MIREILRMGDPRLLRVAKRVDAFGTAELVALIEDMRETMLANDGAGLAAPQIGVDLRVVMFGFESNPRYPDVGPVPFTVLINPELIIIGEEMAEAWEGCLSVPGLRGWVPRFVRLRYCGYDQFGTAIDRTVEGFHARVVQHECDHLDGMLYPVRMRDMSRFGFQDVLSPAPSDLPIRPRCTAGPRLEGAVEGGGAVEAQVGPDDGDRLVGSGQ